MKFTWKYNLDTEISRLIFTANNIALGFYQRRGFLVFDKFQKEYCLPISVIFPYQEISTEVWKKLQGVEIDVGQEDVDEAFFNEFKDRYKDIELIDDEALKTLKSSWAEIEGRFNETFAQTFPHIRNKNEVVIMPTRFGTVGSYFDDLNGRIFIYIRVDQDPSLIVELLVKSLIREQFYPCSSYSKFLSKRNLWHAHLEIANFILKTTGFRNLIANSSNLLSEMDNPEIDLELIKESKLNFQKLGFPIEKDLVLDGERIRLANKVLKNLTITQRKLLVNFLKKEGEIVSLDEIAAIMWGEDYYDRFSLTAMSKMIFQLRQKLKEAGLQKEVIFTKRGEGYVLMK